MKRIVRRHSHGVRRGCHGRTPDMAKYDKSCKLCHATGTANAPKTGDAAAWEPRLAKGMDASDAIRRTTG